MATISCTCVTKRPTVIPLQLCEIILTYSFIVVYPLQFCFTLPDAYFCLLYNTELHCTTTGQVSTIGGGRGQWLGGTMASAEHEPITGVWGQSPQPGPGAEPLVRGSGGEAPLKLKAFWSLDIQRSRQIWPRHISRKRQPGGRGENLVGAFPLSSPPRRLPFSPFSPRPSLRSPLPLPFPTLEV